MMFAGGEYQFVFMVVVLLKRYKQEWNKEQNKNIKLEQGMQMELWISLKAERRTLVLYFVNIYVMPAQAWGQLRAGLNT